MAGRFDRALQDADMNSMDADGKWRMSTPSRADYAWWNVVLGGKTGWAVFTICLAALAALLVWLWG